LVSTKKDIALSENYEIMNQIVLNIDQHHTADFLTFLKTLTYVEVKKVKQPTALKPSKKVGQSPHLALLAAAKPIRSGVTLAQLAHEQGYVKTNWQRLGQLAKDMDIQEPIEELFAQLKA
jgi:hypothetical protein